MLCFLWYPARLALGWIYLVVLLFPFVSSATTGHSQSLSTTSTLTRRQTSSGNLSYVADSGICETTPGVHQMSGYIDISHISSMFFWFFESRNDPDNAPFTLWLNGGPGCSSLMGLFQENGPCTVNADGKSTTLNPYSWNNVTNIIYLDNPIGAGFSYGTAAADVADSASWAWRAFQILFSSPEFSKYQSRKFILATESYGAHFAPEFATYFSQKNEEIMAGKTAGAIISVSAMAISDGKHDSMIQFGSLATFASNAPSYGPLQNQTVIDQMNNAFLSKGGCKDQLQVCYDGPLNSAGNKMCYDAYNNCTSVIMNIGSGGLDKSDLRQTDESTNPFPPNYYQSYLDQADIRKAIGATGQFSACNGTIKDTFNQAGDLGRSALPKLAALANLGMPMLIWGGDADIKADWLGIHDCMVSMPWYGNTILNSTAMTVLTIDDHPVASFKTVDRFSFIRVFGAGHAMPAFQPKVALELFAQMIAGSGYHNVSTSSGDSSPTGNGPGSSSSSSHSSGNSGSRRIGVSTSLLLVSLLIAALLL